MQPATSSPARLRRGTTSSASALTSAVLQDARQRHDPRVTTSTRRLRAPPRRCAAKTRSSTATAPSSAVRHDARARHDRARLRPRRMLALEPPRQSRAITPAAQSARRWPAPRPPRSHAGGSEGARNDLRSRHDASARHDREPRRFWLARGPPSRFDGEHLGPPHDDLTPAAVALSPDIVRRPHLSLSPARIELVRVGPTSSARVPFVRGRLSTAASIQPHRRHGHSSTTTSHCFQPRLSFG